MKTTVANLIKSNKPLSNALKFKPVQGNSFRSFREYRLKMVNQSPLKKELFKRFHQKID